MERLISFRLSRAFSFLYGILIILSSFNQYTGLAIAILSIFLFPYLLINFKYLMSVKYEMCITNLLIIILITVQLADNFIFVIQLFIPSLITYTIATIKSLLVIIKGVMFLIIGLQLIKKKINIKLKLLKINFVLLGIFYIMLGSITQLSVLSFLAQLGITTNILFIVYIFSKLLYIILLFLFGVLFRNNSFLESIKMENNKIANEDL